MSESGTTHRLRTSEPLGSFSGLSTDPRRVPDGAAAGPQLRVKVRSGRAILVLLLTGSFLALAPGMTGAQQEPASNGALHVFLDCHTRNCDTLYFRTEITFVNWVRDRQDAEVHVIVTSLGTGSGGSEIRVEFIGLEDLEGSDDVLTYTSLGTDTRDETVTGLTRTLAVGLARYATLAGRTQGFDVVSSEPARDLTGQLVSPDEVEDPWDFWVFRVGLDGEVEGETSETSKEVSGDFSATRTTDVWKIDVDFRGSYSRRDLELSEGEELSDERTEWDVGLLVAYSLAEHWSIGGDTEVEASTRFNRDLLVAVSPALEFSFFPYAEAPRRSLTAFYEIGPRYYNYEEETVFGKTSETRFQQSLSLRLFLRQPWGTSSASITGSTYVHDLSRNNLSMSGDLSFRVFRGLNLNAGANVQWIRDQLFLSAEGLTDEEILLRRRRRESDFDWGIDLGFSYQFGSIYNNVVNNRLSRRGRRGR
jgi:hypothetical protein